MKNKKILNKITYATLALALVVANFGFLASHASAATLTNTYIEQLSRMAQAQTTSFRVVFKTVSAGATSVVINFNGTDTTTWTGTSGVVNATQTVSSASCAATSPATTIALPGTITAAGAASTVTISSVTALSATQLYCVDLTSATAITNATAGEYHPTVTVGSDSTTIAIRTVGVSADQIVVSATVPPSFNIALSGNTDSFTANLAIGSVGVTTGRTVTINTNAKNGWFAWAYDSSTGLISAFAAHTIPATTPGTTATLSAGTEGYVFGITAITQGTGGGTTSSVAAYNSNGTTTGSGLDASVRQIASSTGTANGAVLTVKELASISAVTQPGTDYTDTITILGAGYF
jgi:hypothetical protein